MLGHAMVPEHHAIEPSGALQRLHGLEAEIVTTERDEGFDRVRGAPHPLLDRLRGGLNPSG